MNYKNKIAEIASDILNLKKEEIDFNKNKEHIDSWDSFAHLALISSLEEEISITIPFEKIEEINKLQDILEIIESENGE